MGAHTRHDRNRDTGMAIALLLLIVYAATRRDGFVAAAGAVLIVTMTMPAVLRPLAVAWFAASHALGAVISRMVMTVAFFVVVTPVGVVRRMLGTDPMRLREFGRGSDSVLAVRDHRVRDTDLVNPY